MSNKDWCVRIFKFLDHDKTVGSIICMFKIIDLTNILFSIFAPSW